MKMGYVAIALACYSSQSVAVSPECQTAQDYAKQEIQIQRLREGHDGEGAYEAAVRARRMYKIILDGITGVCPQGAVDYYQSQWQNAHRSACQFSAQDSICLEDAANKQAAACEERYNGAQAAMTLSSSAEYGGTSYATGYGAMAVFLKDLIEQGTCPDNEKYRGLITEYEQNDATAQQQAADAEQQRVQVSRYAAVSL